MKNRWVSWFFLILSIGFYLVMASSMILLPMDEHLEIIDRMDSLPGIVFYVSGICGCICQIILDILRKKELLANGMKKNQARKGRIGLFNLFQNIPAIIADVLCVLSVSGLIFMINISNGLANICYVMLAVCIFSFCLHCIFNGRIFNQIINNKRIFKEEA